MLTHFFGFEIRYWLRSWMLWIFLLIIALMIFGATATDQIIVGGALDKHVSQCAFRGGELLLLHMPADAADDGGFR